MMFHEEYPPVSEIDLVFWKYKSGVALDDKAVYEKYRFGKGALKALEALPIEEIIGKIGITFSAWKQNTKAGQGGESCRFDCMEQTEYWKDAHFWIFLYGRKTENQKEIQLVRFSCHNLSKQQLETIAACMEDFDCPLHIKEESNS